MLPAQCTKLDLGRFWWVECYGVSCPCRSCCVWAHELKSPLPPCVAIPLCAGALQPCLGGADPGAAQACRSRGLCGASETAGVGVWAHYAPFCFLLVLRRLRAVRTLTWALRLCWPGLPVWWAASAALRPPPSLPTQLVGNVGGRGRPHHAQVHSSLLSFLPQPKHAVRRLAQAQKKRKQFEAQQRARAEQLAAETAAESSAALAAAMSVAPVHVSAGRGRHAHTCEGWWPKPVDECAATVCASPRCCLCQPSQACRRSSPHAAGCKHAQWAPACDASLEGTCAQVCAHPR